MSIKKAMAFAFVGYACGNAIARMSGLPLPTLGRGIVSGHVHAIHPETAILPDRSGNWSDMQDVVTRAFPNPSS